MATDEDEMVEKVSQLRGEELISRRWRGTLSFSLTDERTGEIVSRAVTMSEVWEDAETFEKCANGLKHSLFVALDRHVEKGVGISG